MFPTRKDFHPPFLERFTDKWKEAHVLITQRVENLQRTNNVRTMRYTGPGMHRRSTRQPLSIMHGNWSLFTQSKAYVTGPPSYGLELKLPL